MSTVETHIPETAQKKKPQRFWKIVKYLLATSFVLGIFAVIFIGVYILNVTKNLPTLDALRNYSPSVMSRVHAGDGKIIAEYGIEKRVFVPIESIPIQIQHALVASEDKRFYTHDGFDPKGLARALKADVGHILRKERLEGGSTLTQQVTKHFLVGNERKVGRKIREILIAKQIEKAISKGAILELYLNDVYFGRRAYGIAGASVNYFDKPLDKLTLGQMAYLAGLVKGPNNYQLKNNMERAINRRNYVLGRMAEDGYITPEQEAEAKKEELAIVERMSGDEYLAAEYFVSEVRKKINGLYGEQQLNEGGLSIRTTLDTKMQLAARTALRRGLEMYDRRHGYRGALTTIEDDIEWKKFLAEYKAPPDSAPWQLAVVLKAKGRVAEIGFVEGDNGTINIKDIYWAKKVLPKYKLGAEPKTVTEVFTKGDVILVQVKPGTKSGNEYNLRQVPEVNGGIIAMDPHTGRVLALVGGYSFSQSQFNRSTQAYRQPGSAFKPFVYQAALDSGLTPVSQVLDAPFVIEHNNRDKNCKDIVREGQRKLRFGLQYGKETRAPVPKEIAFRGSRDKGEKECGPIFYKPANFNAGKWYGLSTLRLGLEKSRNAMTVRLASDIGMRIIGQYGRNFGIYDETKHELAWALGAGETTLLRMASAYATIVNGGKKVTPTLLDRVQNNKGETVYMHDKRACPECAIEEWADGLLPPELTDERQVVVSPVTAYQMTSMLEGVVKNGTGRQMLRLGRPIAGKTGTTNDFKDAWFMGFSPDLVAGVYVGYDTPRSLGTETGAKVAGPIFRFFMADVLKGTPKVSFRIPDGVLLAPVNRVTGEPSYIGAPDFIYEAFKPGTEPRIGGNNTKINIGGGIGDYDSSDYGFGSAPQVPAIKPGQKTNDTGKPVDGERAPEAPSDELVVTGKGLLEKPVAGLKPIIKPISKPGVKVVPKLEPKGFLKEDKPKEDKVDLDDGLY